MNFIARAFFSSISYMHYMVCCEKYLQQKGSWKLRNMSKLVYSMPIKPQPSSRAEQEINTPYAT
jgi:hypothetical protein